MGLWSARHRAYDREQWREIVETLHDDDDDDDVYDDYDRDFASWL